ncbi:MAG: hypothetical protein IJI45_07390 [Anaerolineaceae bacterium]|nr:hypothetical protein [Anaerolineaceae bacterium]
MSYDLYLRDPVTQERLEVPGHMMYGGNIKCEYLDMDGNYIPAVTTDAYLNITYNYSHYYYEAFPGADSKKEEDRVRYEKDKEKYGIVSNEGGIYSIDGVSGVVAVPILEEMIRRIETRYKDDSVWITSKREKKYYRDRETGEEKVGIKLLIEYMELKREGNLTEEQASEIIYSKYEEITETVLVDEGSTGESYWSDTAVNAIKPLYQLIALSKMRPDGIWSEES